VIRMSVFYPTGTSAQFDHSYYTGEHRKLVQTRLGDFGLKAIDMEKGVSDPTGGPPSYVACGHLTFTSLQDFQTGWAKHGNEIVADVPNFTNIQPVVQISEVI